MHFRSKLRAKAVRSIGALALVLSAGLAAQARCAMQTASAVRPNHTTLLEVTDETGRTVQVPQSAERIVSLAPNLTETLFALGLGPRLVGDTDYCDYPPEAQTKTKIGGGINPSIEKIVALRPDLVLATRSLNRRETVEALQRLGIAVYATDPHSVEGVLSSTQRLAEILGDRDKGEALVARLRARLAALHQRLEGYPPRRVLFVVWTDPLISAGSNTFLADALRWAGARSVVETSQDWPHVSLEEVIRLQPDFLVFAGSHPDETRRDLAALRSRPGWRDLEAVRRARLAVVSDAINRPSPRLVDAIEQLARQLHPEAFAAQPEGPARNHAAKAGSRSNPDSALPARWEAHPCAR